MVAVLATTTTAATGIAVVFATATTTAGTIVAHAMIAHGRFKSSFDFILAQRAITIAIERTKSGLHKLFVTIFWGRRHKVTWQGNYNMREGRGAHFTVLTTAAAAGRGRRHFAFTAGRRRRHFAFTAGRRRRHFAFAAHFALGRFHRSFDFVAAESLVTIGIQKLERSTNQGLGPILGRRRHKVTDERNHQSRRRHFAFTSFTPSVVIG
jgi:hypothetical protein